MPQPAHSFPPFPTRFASLPARAPYNVLLISGWRPLRGFPSWPRRSNTGRLCPRSRASQVHKGQGRGKKRPGRRFHAPKHLRQPSLRSAAAKAGGSESRPGLGGGSQPPWKGPEQRPGCAEGSASVRFLFASQANHSQQLSPCLAALLMCFLLAEKTSRAAAERGGVQGEGGEPGKPGGALTPRTRRRFPRAGAATRHGALGPTACPSTRRPKCAFGGCPAACPAPTFLKSSSPPPGSAGFPRRILRERDPETPTQPGAAAPTAGGSSGQGRAGCKGLRQQRATGKKPRPSGRQVAASLRDLLRASVSPLPPSRGEGKAGGWQEPVGSPSPLVCWEERGYRHAKRGF